MKKYEFHPFDKVLVRSDNNAKWVPQWYSHKDGKDYVTMDGSLNLQCIPYEGNEHLCRTAALYELDNKLDYNRGDFITSEQGSIFICSGKRGANKKTLRVGALVNLSSIASKGLQIFKEGDWQYTRFHDVKTHERKSSEEEKQLLLSKLHEIGKDWDEDKKEIVPLSLRKYFPEIWGLYPKDGDFIIAEPQSNFDKPILFIFHHHDEDNYIRTYAHCLIDGSEFSFMHKEYFFSEMYPQYLCFGDEIETMRLATEEEKNILLSKLHEIGKDWDEEKKEVVEWKWKPRYDECYYAPFCSRTEFTPIQEVWGGDDDDEYFYKKGWAFHTEEECQAMCDKLNAAIKAIK